MRVPNSGLWQEELRKHEGTGPRARGFGGPQYTIAVFVLLAGLTSSRGSVEPPQALPQSQSAVPSWKHSCHLLPRDTS